MDPRRLLTLTAAVGLMAGCGTLDDPGQAPPLRVAADAPLEPAPEPVSKGPAPLPATARPYLEADEADASVSTVRPDGPVTPPPARTGRAAIAAANTEARAASRSDRFVGGVQVFAWAPGRVYEVWTAPLRVTTLTLGPGETVVAKAAGDTVRWQIGDTTSGTGAEARTHVLLKPLERGLETNLVLTTSRRVYWLDLKSGAADGYNAAVAWDAPTEVMPAEAIEDVPAEPLVTPSGTLDAGYRVRPVGRAPGWAPTAVFNDGTRTYIVLPPEVWTDEAPALFVLAASGEAQLVNYRQRGGLLVVDRVFDRAELRSSERRPRVVRLERVSGGRS